MSATAPPDPARVDRMAHFMLKAVNKASHEYRLFSGGDKVLVAVSGGKDSLTLLDLLLRRQRIAHERYTLTAVHLRSDYHCGNAVSEGWLRTWCSERGIPLVTEDLAVAADLATTDLSKCFRCAWLRRKMLFRLSEELGCNKLAFGHHADDIAATVLLNLFYNGRFEWMEPKVRFFEGRLVVIRPLVFVEERDIVAYARANSFPIGGEPCPEGLDSRRALMRRLLREVESEGHNPKRYIYRAVEHYKESLARAGLLCPAEDEGNPPNQEPDGDAEEE